MLYRVKTKEATLNLVGRGLIITPHPAKIEISPEQAQMLIDDYGIEVEPVDEPEDLLPDEPGEALEGEEVVVGIPEAIEPPESEAEAAEPESVESPEEEAEEEEPEDPEEAPKPKRKHTKGG